MIFYIKSKKRKSFKTPAFTFFELILVIIIIGIVSSFLSFDYSIDKLQLAADKIAQNIRFTQSLALRDDKYQPFALNSSSIEQNRSKYWFKQWWQIKFAKDANDIIYYVFSDSPAINTVNFDRRILNSTLKKELAKDFDGRYMYGGDTYLGKDVKTNQDMNLSHYHVVRIELQMGIYKYSNGKVHLVFDNYGNIFLKEGIMGDGGDINPFDESRLLVTSNIYINICSKLNSKNYCEITQPFCKGLIISPCGNITFTKCRKIY